MRIKVVGAAVLFCITTVSGCFPSASKPVAELDKPLFTTRATTQSTTTTTVLTTTKVEYTTNPEEANTNMPQFDGELYDFENKYYYNCLNEKEQTAYRKVYEAYMSFSDTYPYRDSVDDYQKVLFAVEYDNPQIFWLEKGFKPLLDTIDYAMSYDEAVDIAYELNSIADNIVEEANRIEDEFERVQFLHDTIVGNTVYSENDFQSSHQAYGPLLHGACVCEGYSKALALLCQKAGIDNICVYGDDIEEDTFEKHMWNLVKIHNNWYHIDATWDDTEDGDIIYDYFCISETDITRDHEIIDEYFSIPVAIESYDYWTAHGIYRYSDAKQAYNALVEQIATNYEMGIMTSTVVCIRDITPAVETLVQVSLGSDLKHYGFANGSQFKISPGLTTISVTVEKAVMAPVPTIPSVSVDIPSVTATPSHETVPESATLYSDATAAYSALMAQVIENYDNGIRETTIYCESDVIAALQPMIGMNFYNDCVNRGYTFSSFSTTNNGAKLTLTIK